MNFKFGDVVMKKALAAILLIFALLSATMLTGYAQSPSVTLRADGNGVYLNLFSVKDGNAVESSESNAPSLDDITSYPDDWKIPYIAFAIYAPEAKSYDFSLLFSGADYAAVKSGSIVITVNNAQEFSLELVKGINIIYCFGACNELNGAKITYSSLKCEPVLCDTEGEFYVSGDANGDKVSDLRDLIRYKKYFADGSELDSRSAELDGEEGITTADMAVMRKCLLSGEEALKSIVLKYDLKYINRDNEVEDNWNF